MKSNRIKNISILKDCYGCGTCSSICPHNIIKMVENKNGFYSPKIIEENKCTNCGICLSVCSFTSEIKYNNITFTGDAKCLPEDKDFESERTGCFIAEVKANIKKLKYIRKNLRQELKGLTNF